MTTIAKIEWHPGERFPKVGLIVTDLPMEPDWVVRYDNQRGTAEQHLLGTLLRNTLSRCRQHMQSMCERGQ